MTIISPSTVTPRDSRLSVSQKHNVQKKDMVDKSLNDENYGPIGSTILSMTETVIGTVIEALQKENERSNLVWGLFIMRRRYADSNASALSAVDTHMLIAAHFLHHRMQHDATRTKTKLFNLDHNIFVGTSIEDKRKSLEEMIPEDLTVDLISSLDADTAKDLFHRLKAVRKAQLNYTTPTLGSLLPVTVEA